MTTYTPQFFHLPEKVWKQNENAGFEIENAGEGIVIGFIDTGINPTHPSFAYYPTDVQTPIRFNATCEDGPMFPVGSCNGKIVSARHFWTGATKILPVKSSMVLSPFDQSGHGSYVTTYLDHRSPMTMILYFNFNFPVTWHQSPPGTTVFL